MSREISLLLAGDAMLTRPWSHVREAGFLGLVDRIRSADVAIANLETVIHEFKGHAQADCGGIYMASPPEIAAELKWAGFDMLAHANNHSFDYGVSGIVETIEHAERAGLIIAGSGRDLQRARAPQYFQCDGAKVALVAMAADFVSYGKASSSRPDLHGRPGVNPLTVVRKRSMTLHPVRAVNRAWNYCRRALRAAPAWRRFQDLQLDVSWGREAAVTDAKADLDSIAEAVCNAGIVVVSIHAHRQGKWLANFAHHAIEQGASVVFVHGPHHVRGVELYRGRPIFYSMGDFVFEVESITRLPAEAYEQVGLAADAPIEELRFPGAVAELLADRKNFEGFVSSLSIADGSVKRIHLLPIDLQFDDDRDRRGRPKLAAPELGERIIATVANKSKQFGTRIHYNRGNNRGEVELVA